MNEPHWTYFAFPTTGPHCSAEKAAFDDLGVDKVATDIIKESCNA